MLWALPPHPRSGGSTCCKEQQQQPQNKENSEWLVGIYWAVTLDQTLCRGLCHNTPRSWVVKTSCFLRKWLRSCALKSGRPY